MLGSVGAQFRTRSYAWSVSSFGCILPVCQSVCQVLVRAPIQFIPPAYRSRSACRRFGAPLSWQVRLRHTSVYRSVCSSVYSSIPNSIPNTQKHSHNTQYTSTPEARLSGKFHFPIFYAATFAAIQRIPFFISTANKKCFPWILLLYRCFPRCYRLCSLEKKLKVNNRFEFVWICFH